MRVGVYHNKEDRQRQVLDIRSTHFSLGNENPKTTMVTSNTEHQEMVRQKWSPKKFDQSSAAQ